jgi:hypothetical protein
MRRLRSGGFQAAVFLDDKPALTAAWTPRLRA